VIGTLGRQINAVNQTLGLYTNALAALERHSFDPQILTDLANPPPQLAGFAATFKRFATEIQSKRRHQDELASAALIQQSLLPSAASLPDAHGVRLFARMRAARDVGGDFYDHVRLDDRRLAIAIGDVCGKGIPASLFMAVVVTTLRTAARDSASVADTVRRAASLLARDNVASMFATSVFGVIDLVTGDVDYANCGHNPPLVLRRGAVVTTLPSTGLPLGLFESPAPSVAHTRLEPGDALVLYTDGVTEAQGPSTVEFGDERLVAAVSGGTTDDPETIVGRVFDAVDRFVDGAEPFDDITCLAVCR
jgi:sigma-B regulation protein RsbU (phosphoserine phosphatase)